jgi:TolB-like protein
MGTVYYMSPEQARGLPVDARTDLWSLGVVLYELITGKKPFHGPTMTDVIISIADRDPAPLSKQVAEVPAQLEQIVSKALAKDREQRYQTGEALLIDLKDLERELAIGAEVERFKTTSPNAQNVTTSTSQQSPFTVSRSHLAIVAVIAGVLIIGALAYALFVRKNVTTTEIRSIAVLPLENRSGDPSQDYFADGVTESLITDLASTGVLTVISRPSVMRYKGTSKTAPEVGRELNVDAVLTGSVGRSADSASIDVQLIDVATERTLWTRSYNRGLSDVLSLQREVTVDVAGRLKVKTTTPGQVHLRDPRPVNPEAYDHFLRGKFYIHRQNRADNDAAIAALERAVAKDPTFAEAFAELAQAYVWKLFLFAPEEKQWAENAFVAVQKALALDPNLAVAYLARGRLQWTP